MTEDLIQPDRYQVFLLACPASIPLNFAQHPWFVVNKKGVISRWEMFWRANRSERDSCGHLHKDFYPPFQGIEMLPFSNKHFWKNTKLLGVVDGDEGSVAERMIEVIENSPQTYPLCHSYSLVGPNSNTYVQWVLNKFPEAGLHLPWNSFGKGTPIPPDL